MRYITFMKFDNSYARLGSAYAVEQALQPVRVPKVVLYNQALAAQLGIDISEPEAATYFSGSELPEGAEPVAMAYAGHQYAHFVPTLGDGRALLLGEVLAPDGRRFDIHLKGSGPTPFARRGDGRAALAPMLREYIISEAMFALGIPTTRSLAVVASGEPVLRGGPEPGGVLARVAGSHLRIGTFQYFAARQDDGALMRLTAYAIARHYPHLSGAEKPAHALLQAVVEAQADLIAQWLLVGFIHGVMNTDNMSISGETIDYGPCAFMDAYDPATVFSSIDQHGRYAYANQAPIALWNLARLAEALLPVMNDDVAGAESILDSFMPRFEQAWLRGMRRKLGWLGEDAGDAALIADWLDILHKAGADYTNSHRLLGDALVNERKCQELPEGLTDWRTRWQARCAVDGLSPSLRRAAMHSVNPAFIPRNHRVEQALKAAVEQDDFSLLQTLLAVLAHPFEEQSEHLAYRQPPLPDERVLKTFCGT